MPLGISGLRSLKREEKREGRELRSVCKGHSWEAIASHFTDTMNCIGLKLVKPSYRFDNCENNKGFEMSLIVAVRFFVH